jgi:hypothetical protein
MYVDDAVFDEVSLLARKQGRTLYGFINEALSVMAKICGDGGNPSELLEMWRLTSTLKLLDVITLPSDFADDLVVELYHTNKEALLRKASESGSRLVEPLQIIAGDMDTLSELAKDLKLIMPIKEFRIMNDGNNGSIEIAVLGAGRRFESTECCSAFLNAILSGYGYSTVRQETGLGSIRVWGQKRKKFES